MYGNYLALTAISQLATVAMLFLILLALLFAPPAARPWDGEVYLGQYFSTQYPTNGGGEHNTVARTGVRLGHDIDLFGEDRLRLWGEIEVSIDEAYSMGSNGLFHPSGNRYFIGGQYWIVPEIMRLDYTHMCDHHSDEFDGGNNEWFNRVEVVFPFGGK